MAKTNDGKTCAFLSYLLVGIIWFFAEKKMRSNNYAKYHVKQSMFLYIVLIGGNIVLRLIPFVGWALLPVLQLAAFVLIVIGIINSLNGKKRELPIIGEYAVSVFKNL